MMRRMKSVVVCVVGALGVVGDGVGVERRRVGVEARARLEHVGDDQADGERERRDDLEIEQRLAADAADLLHVPGAGNAEDDGAEDDRD